MTQWTSKLGGRYDTRAVALKNGWRSGLEESFAAFLDSKDVTFEYEQHKLSYIVPERTATYTPDFYITTKSGKTMIIETKGRFTTADRQKMILVKATYPHLDIRMVFSNPKARISKASPTTLGMWCDKHGFQYSTRVIPESWLNE